MAHADPEAFLPLTAPEYHVLLALGDQALHGYAMMQSLEERSGGRRRYYRLTELGRAVARAESARLKRLLGLAEAQHLVPERS